MKDICIINSKEQKTISKKIASKLASDGFSCWVSQRDFNPDDSKRLEEIIKDSSTLLLIMDKNSGENKEMTKALEIALDNELEVIPFMLDKTTSNLYSEYFFYSLSWIDAHEESFEDAYDILLEATEEYSGGKSIKKEKKKSRFQNTNKSKQLLIGIAAVLFLVLSWFVYNEFFSTDTQQDTYIIGQWHLVNYGDNLVRTSKDSLNFISNIKALKQNALLIFKKNHSFERRGFSPEPQVGNWYLSDDAKILFLEPMGLKRKDQLHIEELSLNKLTLMVNEQVDSMMVTTRISFTK